jgi:hypothetical protein
MEKKAVKPVPSILAADFAGWRVFFSPTPRATRTLNYGVREHVRGAVTNGLEAIIFLNGWAKARCILGTKCQIFRD